jgi:hypothetical protein
MKQRSAALEEKRKKIMQKEISDVAAMPRGPEKFKAAHKIIDREARAGLKIMDDAPRNKNGRTTPTDADKAALKEAFANIRAARRAGGRDADRPNNTEVELRRTMGEIYLFEDRL